MANFRVARLLFQQDRLKAEKEERWRAEVKARLDKEEAERKAKRNKKKKAGTSDPEEEEEDDDDEEEDEQSDDTGNVSETTVESEPDSEAQKLKRQGADKEGTILPPIGGDDKAPSASPETETETETKKTGDDKDTKASDASTDEENKRPDTTRQWIKVMTTVALALWPFEMSLTYWY